MDTTPTPKARVKSTAPARPEINQYTIKFLIGWIALLLPAIEYALSLGKIASISESYWYPDSALFPYPYSYWTRSIFVGSLVAIAALLSSYNGTSSEQLWLGKVAAAAALLIANFPCSCGQDARETIRGVHGASAGVLFAVLAWFCRDFILRAKTKLHDERRTAAIRRIRIYQACGIGMLIAIALFVWHAALPGPTTPKQEALIFWGETVGLVSFGVSWLTASRKLPVITHPTEKQRVFGWGTSRTEGQP